jgi:hypothetical protein
MYFGCILLFNNYISYVLKCTYGASLCTPGAFYYLIIIFLTNIAMSICLKIL